MLQKTVAARADDNISCYCGGDVNPLSCAGFPPPGRQLLKKSVGKLPDNAACHHVGHFQSLFLNVIKGGNTGGEVFA
jgi:hypothetical protein